MSWITDFTDELSYLQYTIADILEARHASKSYTVDSFLQELRDEDYRRGDCFGCVLIMGDGAVVWWDENWARSNVVGWRSLRIPPVCPSRISGFAGDWLDRHGFGRHRDAWVRGLPGTGLALVVEPGQSCDHEIWSASLEQDGQRIMESPMLVSPEAAVGALAKPGWYEVDDQQSVIDALKEVLDRGC